MAISDKITSITNHLIDDYKALENLGADLTNVDKNIENIKSVAEQIYDNLPKTEYQEGTEINLGKTIKGKLDYDNGVVGIGQSEQAILPSEYQQVEYIESSGTQYIDTGIKGNNQYRIDSTFKTKTISISQAVYGTFEGNESTSLYLYCSSGKQFQVGYGTFQNLDVSWQDNTLYETSLRNGKIIINGTENTISTASSFTTNNNLIIFKVNGSSGSGMSIQLYDFKMYDNNVLVRNFIPCYRISDNVIGLYDIVNNVFYTNQGSGTFTKGANAPTPNAEIPIKCVTGNIEEVVRGKNFFNYDDITNSAGYINNYDGTFTSDGNKNNILINVNASSQPYDTLSLKAGTYAVSFDILVTSNTTFNSFFCCTNVRNYGSTISQSLTANVSSHITTSYTITDDAEKVGFAGYLSSSTGVTISNLQVEQGSTATTYEPYITPTSYQLSLGDIELNAIGNYKDELIYDVENDKVYKKAYIGKLQMTKDLPWNASTYDTAYQYFIRTYNLDNFLLEKHQKYCNYFEYNGTDYKTAPIPSLTENDSTYVASNFMLVFKTDGTQGTTLNEWKSWLDNHTMWVVYRLTTPTLTEITDTPLKAQVKVWYNAHSNNGTTIITSNGNLPMIIKVRGLKGE